MKKGAAIAAFLGVFLTAGCIDETTTIVLNRDGSGSIYKTTYLSGAAMGMMGGMMAGMEEMSADGKPAAKKNKNPLMDEAAAKKAASEFGSGVTFVSIKEVKKSDNSTGATVVYKFQDISKLKISMNKENDMNGPGAEMGSETASAPSADNKNPITFAYTPGKLTINMPKPEIKEEKPSGETGPAPEADTGPTPEVEAGAEDPMMAGMFQMFKGMRIRQMIQLPSEIKDTNAAYVSNDSKTGKKQFITLVDISIDKLLTQPDGKKKMQKLQMEKDPAKQMELLKGIDGIKIETAQKVNVKF